MRCVAYAHRLPLAYNYMVLYPSVYPYTYVLTLNKYQSRALLCILRAVFRLAKLHERAAMRVLYSTMWCRTTPVCDMPSEAEYGLRRRLVLHLLSPERRPLKLSARHGLGQRIGILRSTTRRPRNVLFRRRITANRSRLRRSCKCGTLSPTSRRTRNRRRAPGHSEIRAARVG